MLAKAGWYGGNPSTIWTAPIDEVINCYYFEILSRDYEATEIAINREIN